MTWHMLMFANICLTFPVLNGRRGPPAPTPTPAAGWDGEEWKE